MKNKDEIIKNVAQQFNLSSEKLNEDAEYILEPIFDEMVEYIENYGMSTVMAVLELINRGLTAEDFTF